MAKTYLEQMISNLAIPADRITEEFKGFLIEQITKAGLNPDDEVDAGVMKFEPFKCSICQKVITDEYGNNAQPVNNGKCCDNCNTTVVIPARINSIK